MSKHLASVLDSSFNRSFVQSHSPGLSVGLNVVVVPFDGIVVRIGSLGVVVLGSPPPLVLKFMI